MRLISPLYNIRISRWAKLLAGLAFVGIGVAFTKQANLLSPSFEVRAGFCCKAYG